MEGHTWGHLSTTKPAVRPWAVACFGASASPSMHASWVRRLFSLVPVKHRGSSNHSVVGVRNKEQMYENRWARGPLGPPELHPLRFCSFEHLLLSPREKTEQQLSEKRGQFSLTHVKSGLGLFLWGVLGGRKF